jgi:hypothetical protein
MTFPRPSRFSPRSGLALLALTAAAVVSCGSSAQEGAAAVPLATATPDEPTKADESGTLDVLSMPAADVLIDGVPAGKTPLKGFKVAPGKHDVTFVDESGRRTMGVSLEPGEGKTVTSDRLPSAVTPTPAAPRR